MTSRLPTLNRAVAILAAAAGVGVHGGAMAQGWQPTEDDQLLLELHSGSYRLGDTLRGYQTPAGVCVDMADLIQALDLPVRLDKKSRRATGWIFTESEEFTLDREANAVQTMNNAGHLGAADIVDTPEGWCANVSAMWSWFGVTFRPDLTNLSIIIETDRKLPFLEAIQRKIRAARLSARSNLFDISKLPRQEVPYELWRAPSVDIQVIAALRGGGIG